MSASKEAKLNFAANVVQTGPTLNLDNIILIGTKISMIMVVVVEVKVIILKDFHKDRSELIGMDLGIDLGIMEDLTGTMLGMVYNLVAEVVLVLEMETLPSLMASTIAMKKVAKIQTHLM